MYLFSTTSLAALRQIPGHLFLILLLISGVIGARLYSVINYWSYFSANPIQILNLRGGGLGIIGAIIFGIIFIFFFSKKNKINFLKITNTLIPIIPLCQSIGRLGNFFNKEIPTWWLESILNLILFFIIIKTKKNQTAFYLIGYGLIRFFTEFIRLDTIPIYFLSLAQILSLLFILIGSIIIRYENSRH